MRTLIALLLASSALSGCYLSHERVEARDGAISLDAGTDPPTRFDDAGLPFRCVDPVSTLVVGPEPGCARVTIPGGVRSATCEGADFIGFRHGQDVRVIRRGTGEVTIAVLCGGEPCDDPESFAGARPRHVCWACESSGHGFAAAPGERTAAELPFGRVQLDGVAEYVIGSEDELVVEACLMPYPG